MTDEKSRFDMIEKEIIIKQIIINKEKDMEPRVSIITLGVKDLEASYEFYKNGLGFPTSREEGAPIVFFRIQGTCFALYPIDELAKDIGEGYKRDPSSFSGITLAHNTKEKDQVDQVMALARASGAKIVKEAADTIWGGYSGYFSDPDGYLWEIAYGAFEFNADGSLQIP